MNPLSKPLFNSFVKPFYKENAGTFVFLFTMMFCIISKVDGAGLFEYHYSLVIGMLTSNTFLFLVLFVWLLYARKYTVFVYSIITNPHYGFLQLYNQLSKPKRFMLFFLVEIWLLLPLLLYYLFIAYVGLDKHLYLPVSFIAAYLLLLCCASATWHVYLLNNPNERDKPVSQQWFKIPTFSSSYQFILLRFVVARQSTLWAGIKIFTCGVLYLIVRNNTSSDYDLSLPFLFYSFGILANGVLLYRIREFEETYLHFYRGLPVPLVKRLLQYTVLQLVLFAPELITIIKLSPVHFQYANAVQFILCGFGLLLFMHSITLTESFTMKDYIKILLGLFFVECLFLITLGFTFLYLFLIMIAVALFLKRYYQFEQKL